MKVEVTTGQAYRALLASVVVVFMALLWGGISSLFFGQGPNVISFGGWLFSIVGFVASSIVVYEGSLRLTKTFRLVKKGEEVASR